MRRWIDLFANAPASTEAGARYNISMLAVFCLRLALGMLASLLLLSHRQMHARFFRTHFLTALGLCIVALLIAWGEPMTVPAGIAAVGAFAGALVWMFDRPPAGWTFWTVSVIAAIAALALAEPPPMQGRMMAATGESAPLTPLAGRLANDLTSALLLGSTVTAMLVGHSYLIAPSLSIRPLMVQLALIAVALVLRSAVAGVALGFWTAKQSFANLSDEAMFLPVRWLVGIAGPALFGFLAYRTAQIRSTQSATGILYVVVILAFLGELTALVLFLNTGLPL